VDFTVVVFTCACPVEASRYAGGGNAGGGNAGGGNACEVKNDIVLPLRVARDDSLKKTLAIMTVIPAVSFVSSVLLLVQCNGVIGQSKSSYVTHYVYW